MEGSIVLQCLQKPNTFREQKQTMGFAPDRVWEHVDQAQIERMTDATNAIIPYGILLRTFAAGGADSLQSEYSSPVDKI